MHQDAQCHYVTDWGSYLYSSDSAGFEAVRVTKVEVEVEVEVEVLPSSQPTLKHTGFFSRV
jgi:uncharacterized protein YfdQ (DUF2303 family)